MRTAPRIRAAAGRPRVAPGISVAKISRISVRSVSTAARRYCLVVPEQLERFVGIGDASDVEQQAHVEDIGDLTFWQRHAPRQCRSDQTRAQCRVNRQAVSEIGNDRKTTEKIGKSKPFTHRSIDPRRFDSGYFWRIGHDVLTRNSQGIYLLLSYGRRYAPRVQEPPVR